VSDCFLAPFLVFLLCPVIDLDGNMQDGVKIV
jgi:hypothetical protein